jgi:hypothetical protein
MVDYTEEEIEWLQSLPPERREEVIRLDSLFNPQPSPPLSDPSPAAQVLAHHDHSSAGEAGRGKQNPMPRQILG